MSDLLKGERPDFVKVLSYRPPESEPDPALRHNQMALVFPPPESDENVLLALAKRRVRYPAGFFDQPVYVRKESLLRMNTAFHYVFPTDLAVVRRALAVVRASYVFRNPANEKVYRVLCELMRGEELKIHRLSDAGGGSGHGLLLTGVSGVGKSSLLDRLVDYIGAYGRFHQSLRGEPAQWPQLGVIRVNVGHDWRSTNEAIMGEIRRQLGRNVYPSHGKTRTKLEQDVHHGLTIGFAPLLIVDEIQRLDMSRNKTPAAAVLRGLNDMMTHWGVPVILVGTMKTRQLFERFPGDTGKYTTGGEIKMNRLLQFDADTNHFVAQLRRLSVSKSAPRFSDDFNKSLWYHTMGVRRFMVEFMRVALTRHAEDEKVNIDSKLLRSIDANELRGLQRPIAFLRRMELGFDLDFHEYQLYEDYYEEAFHSEAQSAAQLRIEAQWKAENPRTKDGEAAYLDPLSFEKLQARLSAEEAADRIRVASTTSGGPAPRKQPAARSNRKEAVLAKAARKVKSVAGVASLKPQGLRGAKPASGIAPGDIR